MMRCRAGARITGFLIVALLPAAAPASDPAGAARAYSDAIERGHALLRDGAAAPTPVVAIILDDLGEQPAAGLRAAALPGAVACAFLPFGEHTARHAELAHRRGKEVLLHLPLEPLAARRHPTSLTARSTRGDLETFVRRALAAVPHVRGVNNHQGSLMTGQALPMQWLMAELAAHPVYFIDSRTTPDSLAYRVALFHRVPAAERGVFLDNVRGEQAVRENFRRLLARAHRDGSALAIGHPYPETFDVLEEELPRLERHGVRLVPPSALIAIRAGAPSAAKRATRTAGPGLPATMSAAAR